MYVENKKMYHIHRTVCGYNEIWHENNEIIVSENFNNSLYLNTLSHHFGIEKEENQMNSLCKDILHFQNKLEEKSKEEIYDFLTQISYIAHNIGFRDRELFLEEYRRLYHPSLPSRWHCLYLCEEEQLKYWKKELNEDLSYKTFQVEVEGDLFKTSAKYLPPFACNMEDAMKYASIYWNLFFNTQEEIKQTEYLFQGQLKIVKELKN